MTEIKYGLESGLTIPLRGLTWSKEDDAANESLYVWEALDDAWRKLHDETSGVKPEKKPEHAANVAKTRLAARQAGREFLTKFVNSKLGTEEIESKVIPQLTDADTIVIMRTAREGVGWHDRYLESLWSRDPISMFESKLDALCKTVEGKAYLSALLPSLQKQLQPAPESTTQPTPAT